LSPIEIGIIGVIALFALMALGMPIGLSMGVVGFMGLAVITSVEAAINRLGQTAFTSTASYVIAVLPLFVLMGEFASLSGLSGEGYKTMHKWLGRLPGGLAMATIGGCAGFAAVCGSSLATATTMASVALPEMRELKYDPRLATGSLAAGGTLGILIPPSTAFVLYGIITEQPIGKLLLSGVLPGILLSLLFIILIYIWATWNPSLAPSGPKISWRERLISLKDLWALLILFLVVMGGIYAGIFTATEAAGAGAFVAFLIGLGRRRLTKETIIASFMNTLRTTGMVFILIICATFFGYFVAISGLAVALAGFIGTLPIPSLGVLIVVLLVFLILGCMMDAYSMMLIVVPIVYPVVLAIGVDPIFFGVLMVIMMEMGLITPPIGMNVFAMAGVARDISMYTIFRGVFPFVLAMAVCVAILIAFPQIALFLPNAMK